MAGLVPAIHVFARLREKDVDARDQAPGMTRRERSNTFELHAFRRHFLVLPESFTASKVANSTL